jgi:hypothetical protein
VNHAQLGPAPTRYNNAATPAADSCIGPTIITTAVTLTSAAKMPLSNDRLDIGMLLYLAAKV